MTIWLEESTVRQELIELVDADGEIVESPSEEATNDVTFTVEYANTLTLNERELHNIERFLGSIGTGDPEIEFEAAGNSLQVSITADRAVYRPD